MIRHILTALLIFELLNPFVTAAQQVNHPGMARKIQEFLNKGSGQSSHQVKGKRWALLVAGSREYYNYRHQADICHAYQVMKKGGLDDENIIVFMYDDIAFNPENPRRGVIINSPNGHDVYKGVPKDYTGNETSVRNLLAVILGDKSSLTGGSGKVLNTGPDDHIFIYYADHGGAGIVAMPTDELLYARDLMKALKMKHKHKGYKSMVFYLEACESGSMFHGLLPKNLNIYATTASNPTESSFATYCSDDDPSVAKFDTCLGDAYSVAWMEDSDENDSRFETLAQQYQVVKKRTLEQPDPSHVMQYGNRALGTAVLSLYIGVNHVRHKNTSSIHAVTPYRVKSINQRDADLYYYRQKLQRVRKGSNKWLEAHKQYKSEMDSRKRVDYKIKQISKILSGDEPGNAMLNNTRPAGLPLVDDWSCYKTFVETYEKHCGRLSNYGRKYMRLFANMCNAGINVEDMVMATEASCK